MMESPLLQFAIAAAIIWGTLLLLKAIKPFLPATTSNGNSGSNSGTQPVTFWRSEFKAIVDSGLNDRVVPILDKQTEILSEMAKGINELVIIQRDERVRRAAGGK